MEKKLFQILKDFDEGNYGSHELLDKIGHKIDDSDSIVGNASINGVPLIIPAFTDSIMGLNIWSLSKIRNIRIDPFKDLDFLINKQFDLRKSYKRTGVIILGGGVPKNFIFQSALTADKPFDYVVQIVTDRPEFGGLSGATINEAKTWKKVNQKARISTVNCDISIALPLLISSILS